MKFGRRNIPTWRTGPRLKLFISYRRRFDHGSARLLRQELAGAFGDEAIFRDIEDIAPGEQFPQSIDRAVESCDVLLVVISPGWVDAAASLWDPDDFVRREIAAALARPTRVIPVLVGGARMPEAKDLPADLSGLASLQAVELSDNRWDYDVGLLVEAIRPAGGASAPASHARAVAAAAGALFATRRGAFAVSLLLFAALAYAAHRYGLIFPTYQACVRRQSGIALEAAEEVEAGVRDWAVLRPEEYGLARVSRPEGLPLLLRLTDSGQDLGAVLLRYFKEGQVFKVERIIEPRCADSGQYLNDDRPAGDKHVLQNWDRLRVRLRGRDYLLRIGDRGDRVTATLAQAPQK